VNREKDAKVDQMKVIEDLKEGEGKERERMIKVRSLLPRGCTMVVL